MNLSLFNNLSFRRLRDNEACYRIQNICRNRSYIGQSFNVGSRLFQHIQNSKYASKPTLIDKKIRQYGIKAFNVEIFSLQASRFNNLDDFEIYLIDKYKTFPPPFGYNRTAGGENGVRDENLGRQISNSKLSKDLTIDEEKLMVVFASAGFSSIRIGELFGVGYTTVLRRLRRYNFNIVSDLDILQDHSDLIVCLRNKGLAVSQIADEICTKPYLVEKILKREGLSGTVLKRNTKKIMDLYFKGCSLKRICEEIGSSQKNIKGLKQFIMAELDKK